MAVLGLGGVFIKCGDLDASKAWYQKVLGLKINDYGGFDFEHGKSAEAFGAGARTIFSMFAEDVEYFGPSQKSFMINLMVDDLDAMLAHLKALDIPLVGEPEDYSYGKFAWIMDPNGVKLELWQPLEPPAS